MKSSIHDCSEFFLPVRKHLNICFYIYFSPQINKYIYFFEKIYLNIFFYIPGVWELGRTSRGSDNNATQSAINGYLKIVQRGGGDLGERRVNPS